MLYWLYLTAAILLEITGTTLMKLSNGFTRILPSVLVFPLYGASVAFLILSLKRIEVSVAYAVWSAVGTALISTIGIVGFKESLTPLKAGSLILIIIGVVGLHLSQPSQPAP